MAKIALIFVLAFVCLQLASATPRVPRDAPEEKKTDQIDEALNVMKTKIEQTLKTFQDSDMLKELNEKMQKIGAEIAAQGKQIADKIQSSGKTE